MNRQPTSPAILAVLALITMGVVASGSVQLGPVPGGPVQSVSVPSRPPLVDGLGDTLRAGPRPERIVSLSPNTTEILFTIGVDPERMAGVTRYCDFPPEAKTRPQVGGIIDPSLERIQMIRPDLVVVARGNPVEVQERIRSMGIPVFAVDDRTGLDGIAVIVEQLIAATLPEDSARADSVLATLRGGLRAYQAWSDSIPPPERLRVYYADPENPDWTAGPGSHIDDLLRRAGGVNIVRAGGAWPQYSTEALLMEQPDWILMALPMGSTPAELRHTLGRSPAWSQLKAFREDRICWIDSDRLLRPGPRILSALADLAACLHPDRPRPLNAPRRPER